MDRIFHVAQAGENNVRTMEVNTTVNDGEHDYIGIVLAEIRNDTGGLIAQYGKYVVYGFAGFLALKLLQARKKRR